MQHTYNIKHAVSTNLFFWLCQYDLMNRLSWLSRSASMLTDITSLIIFVCVIVSFLSFCKIYNVNVYGKMTMLILIFQYIVII